jgi:hypothetical protein
MGDVATLAKARMELEELYLGIPDESVNLTFQDLAEVTQNVKASEKKKSTKMEPISEVKTPRKGSPLIKIPSLDFNTGGFQHVMKSTHDTGDHLYRGGHVVMIITITAMQHVAIDMLTVKKATEAMRVQMIIARPVSGTQWRDVALRMMM